LEYVQAKHNVTIDNKNSTISYSGDWEFQDDYDNGASDHWTNDDDAEAEFKFTGSKFNSRTSYALLKKLS